MIAHDPARLRSTWRALRPLRDSYFRTEVAGMERVPDGPALVVANHNGGTLPVDGIAFGMAWHERHDFARPLCVLMHDLPFRIAPPLSRWLRAHGVVPASREGLGAAVGEGHAVLVFPGGAREAFRTYRERRSVTLGDRTGFVAMALRHRVPVVPVVGVGAHETLVVLSSGRRLAEAIGLPRLLRADVLPLWLGLPWGVGFGPMPHIPLPARLQVEVLEPLRLWERLASPDPEDPRALREGLELVRSAMQAASDRLHAARRWPVLG